MIQNKISIIGKGIRKTQPSSKNIGTWDNKRKTYVRNTT